MINTHELNADQAVAEVRKLEEAAELREVLEHEKGHPRHEGGRKTVVDAIEERLGELASKEPAPPIRTRAEPRRGGSYLRDQLIHRTGPRRGPGEGEG